MRLLFLAIIIHLFSINVGYSMEDERQNMNGRVAHLRIHIPDAQPADEPVHEEEFSLIENITWGLKQVGPYLPIAAYLILRIMQECPGDCVPIE